MRRATLGSAVLLLLAGSGLAQGRPGRTAARKADPTPLEALDAYVEKTRLEWGAPAVGLAVVRNDSVLLTKGYGVLELGKPARADENTVFAIGSSSKAFTTASLAMLIDEGKLRWDDLAAPLLPGWQLADPWVTREITIKDLISHRVGLDRADRIWGGTDFSRDEILYHRQRNIGRIESFRYRFGYNNHMFLAAGRVIENLSGMSWDDFVRSRIFEPLGMKRASTSTKPLAGMTNVATPHGLIRDSTIPIPWKNLDNMAPAGSINASAKDMAEWLRLQLSNGVYHGRRLVSEAAMREMHSPQTVIPIERWYSSASPVNHQMVPGTHFFLYGLGWFLQDYKGHYLVHHGGSIDGMRALVAMSPDDHLGFVILTNQNPSNVDEAIMFKGFDLFLGGPTRDWSRIMLDSLTAVMHRGEAARRTLEASRKQGTTPSLPIAQYAGTYGDPAYGDAVVEEQSGKLTIKFGVTSGSLDHWHYDTFRVDWNTPGRDWSLATFKLGAGGRPTSLSLGGGVPDLVRK
jgi:CubicO group peptidase (beta-lactamase class C family)